MKMKHFGAGARLRRVMHTYLLRVVSRFQ